MYELVSDGRKTAPHPWRRYFARVLDISIYNFVLTFILTAFLRINILYRNATLWNFLIMPLSILLMLFLEPLWLHLFGKTPGKAVFGLRVLTDGGERLSYEQGFERTWGIIARGMGYAIIPFFNLYRMWQSYKVCIDGESLEWEEEAVCTITDVKAYRVLLMIICNAALVALTVLVLAAEYPPPNRGDLTISEYAENHRYYAKYYNYDLDGRQLGDDGKWEDKPTDGYTITLSAEQQELVFETKDGIVTSVGLVKSVENAIFIDTDGITKHATAMALTGASREAGLFSGVSRDVATLINDELFSNYEASIAGVNIRQNVQHSGLRDTGTGVLFSVDDDDQNSFYSEFIISTKQ